MPCGLFPAVAPPCGCTAPTVVLCWQVVHIVEKKHSRAAAGFLKPLADRNSELFKKYALFSPSDHRVPRIYVPLKDCPQDFVTRPKDYADTLFVCRIVDWKEDSNFALG